MHSTLKHIVYCMSRIIAYSFLLSLILCSILPAMEARRLPSHVDEVAFRARRMSSGPSRGGEGHKRLKHFQVFIQHKEFGPSPGEGHE
ncbi:unnamed protein product [Amaranthus hypochondriacus]